MVAARRVLGLGAVVVVLTASACAAPDYRYAAEKPGSAPAGAVYFKVPESWSAFDAAALTKAQAGWSADPTASSVLGATVWQEAFDAAPAPSLTHVLGSTTPASPVVYASLRTLYSAESAGASVAALKDLVVPLSTLGSQVRVRSETALTQGSAKGVHVVFSYSSGTPAVAETIDQTAYLSEGNDAVYLLVVRCSTACYESHRADIDTVTSSYTIQEGSRG